MVFVIFIYLFRGIFLPLFSAQKEKWISLRVLNDMRIVTSVPQNTLV
jgi:hypothetical protein